MFWSILAGFFKELMQSIMLIAYGEERQKNKQAEKDAKVQAEYAKNALNRPNSDDDLSAGLLDDKQPW